jgi:hypothetical protein
VCWIVHVWQNALNVSDCARWRKYFVSKLPVPLIVLALLLAEAVIPPPGHSTARPESSVRIPVKVS